MLAVTLALRMGWPSSLQLDERFAQQLDSSSCHRVRALVCRRYSELPTDDARRLVTTLASALTATAGAMAAGDADEAAAPELLKILAFSGAELAGRFPVPEEKPKTKASAAAKQRFGAAEAWERLLAAAGEVARVQPQLWFQNATDISGVGRCLFDVVRPASCLQSWC